MSQTKDLTPEQHRVLREHGTERPGSSPLNREKLPVDPRFGLQPFEAPAQCPYCDTPVERPESGFQPVAVSPGRLMPSSLVKAQYTGAAITSPTRASRPTVAPVGRGTAGTRWNLLRIEPVDRGGGESGARRARGRRPSP